MSLVEEISAEQTEDKATPAQAVPPTPQKLLPLWRNRDYMLLWSGQLVSTVGSTASQVVLPLLILAITNSPTAAGIAGALVMLPYVIFSLPAGALLDRWDRKRVMIICDTGRCLVYTGIVAAMVLNRLTMWQIYFSAFLEGTFFVFFNIAEVAALPRVVPKLQLTHATAQNQATFAVAGIVGPSIGTILYQSVGRMAPFVADAVSYFVSIISLFFIKADFQLERTRTEAGNLRREITEGLRWLWGQPLIRIIAFRAAGMNLILASQVLVLIVLAKDLGAPEGAIGVLFSIGSIGAIVGSVMAPSIQRRFTFGQIVIGGMWIVTICYPLYAVAPNLIAVGAILAIIFTTFPVISTVVFSYRATIIPDELQGRVNSAVRLISWGSQPVGAFLGGLLIERTDVTTTILVSSGMWLLLAIATTLSPHVRNAPPLEEIIASA